MRKPNYNKITLLKPYPDKVIKMGKLILLCYPYDFDAQMHSASMRD